METNVIVRITYFDNDIGLCGLLSCEEKCDRQTDMDRPVRFSWFMLVDEDHLIITDKMKFIKLFGRCYICLVKQPVTIDNHLSHLRHGMNFCRLFCIVNRSRK